MEKPIKTCKNCINCMYLENGDMFCDKHDDSVLIYEDFCITEDYMWCKGNEFEE